MKLLAIPPRYLDTDTLIIEHNIAKDILVKRESPFLGRFSKFENYLYYVLIRHEMLSSELRRRGVEESCEFASLYDVVLASNGSKSHPKITIQQVQQDVDFLMMIWEEYESFDRAIPSFIEKLALVDSEELWQEYNHLIELYQMEVPV